jgi:agmatinase
MVQLYRANATSIKDADIVIVGVPDESRSFAKRKSTNLAPDILRAASNDTDFFEREGRLIPICPMRGTFDRKRLFDAGNIHDKQELYQIIFSVTSQGKVPIIIGGDHSLTTETLKAASNAIGTKLSILYFDAHPDFVSSKKNYYGSVLMDSSSALDFARSMLIGIRAAEKEELENINKAGVAAISPLDIAEVGLRKTLELIRSRTAESKIYVSIDLDCLDPAFAPGVSVPAAAGLSSIDLIYLLKSIISDKDIIGLDIVELSPAYDVNGITASLAARILSECIASL